MHIILLVFVLFVFVLGEATLVCCNVRSCVEIVNVRCGAVLGALKAIVIAIVMLAEVIMWPYP